MANELETGPHGGATDTTKLPAAPAGNLPAVRRGTDLAAVPNPIVVDTHGMEVPVVTLAVSCGLLRPVEGKDSVYELNPDWFTDPVGKTGEGFSNNPETLALLVAQLIGQASGSSLGIPIKEPGSLGTWYPINKPGTDVPSGLYLATQPVSDDRNADGAQSSVFGLGVMYTKTVSLSSEDQQSLDLVADGPAEIALRVWGLIPVVLMGNGEVSVVAGSAGHPFTMGFEVSSTDGPLVSAGGTSFTGVRFSVDLSPATSPAVTVSLVVTQLTLPTQPQPKDMTLADLQAITGADILAAAAGLAVAALGKLVGDQPALSYLLPALGLSPQVPGVDNASLPILRWDQFVSLAISGGDVARPFSEWFTQLAANGDLLSAWMQAVGGAIGGVTGTDAKVTGSGTRDDPYSVPVLTVSGVGTLDLTGGTWTDQAGGRHFYPGVSFTATPYVLGSSDAAVTGAASMEILDFALTGGGGITPGRFHAGIGLANKDTAQPLYSGTIAGGTYVFGALAGGLSVVIKAEGGATVQPAFSLVNVKTPNGQYATLDLTQPGQLVDAAEAELNAAIGQAFNALFGLGTDSQVGPSLAALIGAAPPPGVEDWPDSLTPPFSAGGLIKSIQDPVAALGGYYAALIRGKVRVDGKPPFFYMIQSLGTVLQQAGGTSGGVTGSGTAIDPWTMPLGSADSIAAVLAFIEPVNDGAVQRLVMGIGTSTTLSIDRDHSLDLNFRVEALGLDAGGSDGAGLQSAQILPGVAFVGVLPNGVATPPVAGASLEIASGSFTASWSPYDTWHWSMETAAPTLVVDGVKEPVGTDMNYSDSVGLAELVTQQASTFASILVGVLGVALYRAERRAGLALDGWFGLLPNLAPFMPEGVTWPENMPALKPTSFDDPLGQVRTQLEGVLATDERAKAVLGLLGWAIDTKATTAAPINGSGTRLDPYLLPLGLPWDIQGSLWQDSGQTMVAPGVAVAQTFTLSSIKADSTVRLVPLAMGWADGKPVNGADLPELAVSCMLTGVDGPLASIGGADIESISVGVTLNLDLSGSSSSFSAAPILAAKISGEDSPLVFSDGISPNDLNLLLARANAGIAAAAKAYMGNDTFQLVYGVMADLGLAVPVVDGYGINPGGWTSLVASPLTYLQNHLMTVLSNPTTQAALFQAVGKTLNITIPAVPEPLLALFAGLGLTTDASHGYAPNPQAIIAVARDPAQQLSDRLVALLSDEAARSSVVAAMTKGNQTFTFGAWVLTTANGRIITLALPRGNVDLGGFLQPSLSARVDMQTGELTVTVDLFIPEAGFSLGLGLDYIVGGPAPAVDVSLIWGSGNLPQPAPLQVFPFDQNHFISQLAQVGPAYVLSIFVAQAVDSVLLAKYPLSRSLFQLFGLADPDGPDGAWQMKSTLGLFEDPLGWLLSDAVVGQNGQLNISQLQKVLSGLPAGSMGGLTLSTNTNGAVLTGLPYGLQVSAGANTSTGLFSLQPALTQPLALVAGAELAEMGFGLTLTSDFQPGLTGSGKLTAPIPGLDGGLFLSGGYDKTFSLVVGQNGEGKPVLSLVPFGGWQTFVLAIAAEMAQKLLQTLTSTLLTELKSSSDQAVVTFANDLETLGTALDVKGLLDALVAAQPDPAKLEEAALEWLRERLDATNAAATASAVATLLSTVLTGVKSDGGLVTYAPSEKVPVTILAGLRGSGDIQSIGVWAELSMSAAQDRILLSLSPTGLGVPLSGDPTPQFQFGLTTQAVIALDQGPGLAIGFDSAGGGIQVDVDPMMTGGKTGDLKLELLPALFGIPGDAPDYGQKVQTALEGWLLDILVDVLPRYVSVVVLNTKTVETWLDSPLFTTVPLTPGSVLTDCQLLVMEQQKYLLNSLENLKALGVAGFLAGFLKALTETQIQVLSFPDGGGIWLEPGPGEETFGVRVAATDLMLKSVPWLVFQLGATDTEWITLTGAQPGTFNPGVAVYVPVSGLNPDFSATKLSLVNIGVDFQGEAGKPLVDMSRFSLGKIKPRGVIAFDFGAPSVISTFGGGMDFQDICISLAPNSLTSGPNTNAVAQNMLGSGDQSSTNNPPANPGFSAVAGWLKGYGLGVSLYDSSGSSDTEIWIPIQRSFGPVHANKVGIGWDNPSHVGSVLFDGSFSLAGLTVDLIDLSVSVDVTRITDYSAYSLGLSGLQVNFSSGGVTIDGGLLKYDDPLRYDGQILVKAGRFSMYAVGSFAMMPVNPDRPDGDKAVSFFLFLNLNMPLGGVPAFFINGVAGGFAINRNILVPDAGNIMSFPLIQGAISQSTFGNDPTPTSALEVLSDVVRPDIGSYWVAAGLKFSSFQLLDVFAMLLVKFGREVEIDVIGVASGSLPPQMPPSKSLAYVELGIVCSFKITEGEISVTAQLTPTSFLLSQDCKLTGGFAAKFWFGSNPNSGDFVITLGGYNPAFEPPEHYPVVPRLGFDWPLLNTDFMSLGVTGGTYFALTPSMMMAGGYLKAQFKAGPLKAWFDAGADFLIAWQPFYFSLGVHVTVGVSFGTTIAGVDVTLTAELGASFDMWGPPFAGKVHVSWFVISFTIPFGDQSQPKPDTQPLDWNTFQERQLPQPAPTQTGQTTLVASPAATSPSSSTLGDPEQVVLGIQVSTGLLSETGDFGPTVQASGFALDVRSVIPSSKVTITQSTFTAASPDLGIRPMDVTDVDTPVTVTLEVEDDHGTWTQVSVDRPGMAVVSAGGGAAAANWSPIPFDPNGKPSADFINGCTFGATIQALASTMVDQLAAMDLLTSFGHEQAKALPLPFAATPSYVRPAPMDQTNRFKVLMETIMAPSVIVLRTTVMQALMDAQVAVIVDQDLSVLAAFADQIYQAPPSLAKLGFDLADSASQSKLAAPARAFFAPLTAAETEAPRAPRLLGTTQLYALPTAPARAAAPAHGVEGSVAARSLHRLMNTGGRVRGRWRDEERRTLHSGSTGSGSETLAVRPGTVSVLDTGTGKGGVHLDLAGGTPVRAYVFDRAGRILSDHTYHPDAAPDGQGIDLLDHAHQVAVVGLANDNIGKGAVVGWTTHTLLAQVGPYTLLGNGFTVRPQVNPRMRQRMRELKRDLIDGSAMLARNRVQTGVGTTAPGWVETVFTHGMDTVAVLLEPGVDPAAVKVSLAAADGPWKVKYGKPVAPSSSETLPHGTLLVFDVASLAPFGEGQRTAVLVRGTDRLRGIFGLPLAWSDAAQALDNTVLPTLARPVGAGPAAAAARATARMAGQAAAQATDAGKAADKAATPHHTALRLRRRS